MPPKRARVSATDAIANILRFVEEDNGDLSSDDELDNNLEELYGAIGLYQFVYIFYTAKSDKMENVFCFCFYHFYWY